MLALWQRWMSLWSALLNDKNYRADSLHSPESVLTGSLVHLLCMKRELCNVVAACSLHDLKLRNSWKKKCWTNRCFLSEPHKGQIPFNFFHFGLRQFQTWDAPLVYLGAKGWSCPSSLSDPPRWETSPSTISVSERQNKKRGKGWKNVSQSPAFIWNSEETHVEGVDLGIRPVDELLREVAPLHHQHVHLRTRTHTVSCIYTFILSSSTQSPQSGFTTSEFLL